MKPGKNSSRNWNNFLTRQLKQMQQDKNHNEKKLQQLENQSLPDLSQMEMHWQKMKVMLQPAVLPVKPVAKPGQYWKWLAAASIIGAALLVYKLKGKTSIHKENSISIIKS